MGRNIREHDNAVIQNNALEIAGLNFGEHIAFAKLSKDLGATVANSRSTERCEVWLKQRLHASLVAARFILSATRQDVTRRLISALASTGLRSSDARRRVHQHGHHPDIRGARAQPTLREERGQRCLSHPAPRLRGSG